MNFHWSQHLTSFAVIFSEDSNVHGSSLILSAFSLTAKVRRSSKMVKRGHDFSKESSLIVFHWWF